MKTTWRKLITAEMEAHKDSWDNYVNSTFPNPFGWDLDRPVSAPFTLWTKDRVYFSVYHDGEEWAESVPRNPCNEAPSYIGG